MNRVCLDQEKMSLQEKKGAFARLTAARHHGGPTTARLPDETRLNFLVLGVMRFMGVILPLAFFSIIFKKAL